MASEAVLKNLFETAKSAPRVFKGLGEQDVWKACQSYKDKSDAVLEGAMRNIQKEEARLKEEETGRKNVMEKSHRMIKEIELKEEQESVKDNLTAELLLKQLTPVVIKKSWWRRIWDYLTKSI
jgi:hypothetical protein